MRGCGTHIGNLKRQITNQFLLDAETPLLNARGLQVRVHNKHGRLNNRLRRVRENLVHDRIRSSADEFGRARGVTREVKPRVSVHWRIENSRSAADNRLAVPETRRPGKAEARRKISLVRKNQVVTKPVVSYKRQIEWRGRVGIKRHRRKILVRIAASGPHDGWRRPA